MLHADLAIIKQKMLRDVLRKQKLRYSCCSSRYQCSLLKLIISFVTLHLAPDHLMIKLSFVKDCMTSFLQLAEAQKQNLELQDQVERLEQRLEVLEQSTEAAAAGASVSTEDSGNDICQQTIKAKDQYIQKLEQETQQVQQQIATLVSSMFTTFLWMCS